MSNNLKKLLSVGIFCVACFALAAPSFGDTGSNPAGTWPDNWSNASAWDNGLPSANFFSVIGRRSDNSTLVNGVIVNLDAAGQTATLLDVTNGATLNINSTGSLTMGGIAARDGGQVNVSGTLVHQQWLLQGNGTWNLLSGGSQSQSTGAVRIAQGAGHNVVWTISGGVYSNTGTDFRVGEGGGTGTINQTGGLAKLNPDLEFWNTGGDAGTWNLSGGQLAITGIDGNPLNYVEMINNGQSGGIVLSGTGELYVQGDRSSDLTLLDSDGDALLSGAVSATYGDWVLSDSTNLIGYTKFTSAPVPEPASFVLAGLGLVGLAGWGLRRRGKK